MKCTCRPRDTCENCFAAQIVELAKLNNWLVDATPTWRPTATTAGVPDLRLVGRGQMIWAEVKREKGRLSRAQEIWCWELSRAGATWRIWRPSDWPEIKRTLCREGT
jgi:hypothetical protein